MKKYTVESLKAINESYDYQHQVTEEDVEAVNMLVEFIEKGRNTYFPKVGDIIEYTNKYGDYYKQAHLETVEKEKLYICERPLSPFTGINAFYSIYTSTSGGAWHHIPKDVKHIGKREKAFVVWGHKGACANGAVTFFAEVNVWEYTEGNPEYTTKTHDKFHVSIREDVPSHEYKYVISKRTTSHTAFHTDEEYQAWLKTYHGVEKEAAWANSKTVWTYKQESNCIPLEEYASIEDAIVDSELCNGKIQECKRIYEGTTVKTFLPFQNNLIEMKGIKQYMRAY